MKVALTKLEALFESLPSYPTDEELGQYWFEITHPTGLIVSFSFSLYENEVEIGIYNKQEKGFGSVSLSDCISIQVDESEKTLQIFHKNGSSKCILSLIKTPILEYSA